MARGDGPLQERVDQIDTQKKIVFGRHIIRLLSIRTESYPNTA